MASSAQSNINVNQKQLVKPVLHKVSTPPESPVEAQFYYNTQTKNISYYDGESWVNIPKIAYNFIGDLFELNGDVDLTQEFKNTVDSKLNSNEKGSADGIAPLNSVSKINNIYLNIDEELNNTSDNPVANSAITNKINEIELAKFPNAAIIGTPTIVSGNISGFSASDYLQFPFTLNVSNLPFYLDMVFTTGEDVTTQQNILDSTYGLAFAIHNDKFIIALSSNGSSWDIGNETGAYTVLANTTYYIRIEWTGTEYTLSYSTENFINLDTDISIMSTLGISQQITYIGASPNLWGGHTAHPFEGTLNFNGWELYVNDILRWQGMDDAGLSARANRSLTNLDGVGQRKIETIYDTNLAYRYSWWFGTVDEFSLVTPDNMTLYVITDDNKIYLGNTILVDKSTSGAIDDALSTTSTNPVQNKVITNALNNKQDSNTAVTHTINTSVGSSSQGVYVDSNGQVQTCDAVTSTYNSSGTAPINGIGVNSALTDRAFVATQGCSTLNNSTVNLSRQYSYYTYTPSASTTFTFNSSNLNLVANEIYTFELQLNMTSSVYTLTFPSSLTWLDNTAPDMSNTGNYLFVFRTIDAGATWIGNLQGSWN